MFIFLGGKWWHEELEAWWSNRFNVCNLDWWGDSKLVKTWIHTKPWTEAVAYDRRKKPSISPIHPSVWGFFFRPCANLEWQSKCMNSYEPGSKLLVLGMVIQPLIGNPYNEYINPYYWVDGHPLLYGNIGSLDRGTYINIHMVWCVGIWLPPWKQTCSGIGV